MKVYLYRRKLEKLYRLAYELEADAMKLRAIDCKNLADAVSEIAARLGNVARAFKS